MAPSLVGECIAPAPAVRDDAHALVIDAAHAPAVTRDAPGPEREHVASELVTGHVSPALPVTHVALASVIEHVEPPSLVTQYQLLTLYLPLRSSTGALSRDEAQTSAVTRAALAYLLPAFLAANTNDVNLDAHPGAVSDRTHAPVTQYEATSPCTAGRMRRQSVDALKRNLQRSAKRSEDRSGPVWLERQGSLSWGSLERAPRHHPARCVWRGPPFQSKALSDRKDCVAPLHVQMLRQRLAWTIAHLSRFNDVTRQSRRTTTLCSHLGSSSWRRHAISAVAVSLREAIALAWVDLLATSSLVVLPRSSFQKWRRRGCLERKCRRTAER